MQQHDTLVQDAAAQIETIRRDRQALVIQIQTSHETIERSKALIKRIDELLAKVGEKP
jgi:uncharacterized coiled-coil DUF342 family protein